MTESGLIFVNSNPKLAVCPQAAKHSLPYNGWATRYHAEEEKGWGERIEKIVLKG